MNADTPQQGGQTPDPNPTQAADQQQQQQQPEPAVAQAAGEPQASTPPPPREDPTPSGSSRERIIRNFTYHQPTPNHAHRYVAIRERTLELALFLNKTCPESAETTKALRHLESAVMWANAAIARNE